MWARARIPNDHAGVCERVYADNNNNNEQVLLRSFFLRASAPNECVDICASTQRICVRAPHVDTYAPVEMTKFHSAFFLVRTKPRPIRCQLTSYRYGMDECIVLGLVAVYRHTDKW